MNESQQHSLTLYHAHNLTYSQLSLRLKRQVCHKPYISQIPNHPTQNYKPRPWVSTRIGGLRCPLSSWYLALVRIAAHTRTLTLDLIEGELRGGHRSPGRLGQCWAPRLRGFHVVVEVGWRPRVMVMGIVMVMVLVMVRVRVMVIVMVRVRVRVRVRVMVRVRARVRARDGP